MTDYSKRTARVAVVGMGYWGKNLVRNFHEIGALAAICDSDVASEQANRAQYPDVPYFRDYTTVLADPTIDAVALATPAASHFALASAALAAGKDVFVEKPIALDVRQGRELVETATRLDRVLMVGHILRYHPAILRMKELIRDGVLGRIQYIYSNRLNIGKIRIEEDILWSFAPHDVSAIVGLLDEVPAQVSSQAGAYLNHNVFDVTVSQLSFPSGVRSHIFVSWLHPFKEQRLVVVGSENMAVFDDTASDKLVVYPHRVEWRNRVPTAVKAKGEPVVLPEVEPLRAECEHFLQCIRTRSTPVTSGEEGLQVLRILDACQRSLVKGGAVVGLEDASASSTASPYFVHPSAFVDDGAHVGAGTKIWHFSHVMKGAVIGKACVIGQGVNIDGNTIVGNNVKIQNNVSVYSGVTIDDDCFLGPSCVFTNVSNPRSQVGRHALYESTRLRRGSTIGANATVVCGATIGRYAFVAAGAVITRDVPDYALMMGNPARMTGWMSRHGHRLGSPDDKGIMTCPEGGLRYQVQADGKLKCIDLDEDAPLPGNLSRGTKAYREFRR